MKKLISVLTAAVMSISIMCQASVFAAFSDVSDDHAYKNAITTLSKLSVIDGYDDGTFKPDGQITRAEFTKLIVFMLGYQDLAYEATEFTDVDASHWAKNYIQTAYKLGIISGMGDGTFAPDANVTYEQALKMVVCTLGYEDFANNLRTNPENWSEGYIKQANALSLTKKVSSNGYTENATRGMIAQVLFNALEVQLYENNGQGFTPTDKTLMGDYLKVTKLKGTLVGVEDFLTEDCKETLNESEMAVLPATGDELIKIDFANYTENTSDITKYLGNTITIFYRELTSGDDKELVIIDDETTKNSEVTLTYEDLNTFSGTSLKYYDAAGKSKSFKLKESELTVRYNGKLLQENETVILKSGESAVSRAEALEKWLTADSGYTIYGDVKLTDNGNDGTVDMIQINNYEIMVAYAAPSSSDYRITDKLVTGNALVLDPQAADYTYTITKDGAEIPVTSIAANDVILYTTSLDGSYYTLLVSNKTVKGSISSISSSADKMTINGTSYNVSEKCTKYINDKEGKTLKTGVSGTFYLDSFGTAIFGVLEQTAVMPYAYITNAYIDREEGGKTYITAYAPTVSASSAESYPVKNKVKLNGSTIKSENLISELASSASYANADDDSNIYGSSNPENIEYSQPARVTISNGEVTQIVTLTTDEVKAQNDDNEQLFLGKALASYDYSSNSFKQGSATAFSVNSSTVVIYVPQNRENREKFAKKTPSSAFTSGESYYVEAYDISSSKIAGLVLVYGSEGTLTQVKRDTDFSIVASLPESTYSDVKDGTVLSFDVFTGSNSTKTWNTYDTDEFADVEVGDVIQFAYDSDDLIQGRIDNIKFSDIADVLDGDTFDWTGDEFEYTFKKNGSTEMYSHSTLGSVPYSIASMYNVSQVLADENKIYVTKTGFVDGELDDSIYEEVSITSSTKILRMEDDRKEISKYADGTSTELTINDLKDAKNYGSDCSKVLVCSSKGNAKLVVIYK